METVPSTVQTGEKMDGGLRSKEAGLGAGGGLGSLAAGGVKFRCAIQSAQTQSVSPSSPLLTPHLFFCTVNNSRPEGSSLR